MPPLPPKCPFFPSVRKLNRDGSNRKGVWFWLPKGKFDLESFGFEISDDEPKTCGKLDHTMVAIIAAYYWRKTGSVDGIRLAREWEAWGGL